MDKADIFRLGEAISGLSNWLKDTMNKNLFKSYPMTESVRTSLEHGIKGLINQIINNDDKIAFQAIEPLYLLKDRIGQFYFDYTVWLLNDAPVTDDIMQEWDINHPKSNLRFGGFDYTEDYDYLSFISNIEGEIRLLSNYLQSREPEEEQEIPTSKKGRKKSDFRDFFKVSYASKTDEIITLMKTQMKGRTGKNAAIVLIAAIKNGYIRTPEKGATDREFGKRLIVRKDFNFYLDEEKSPELWNSKEVEEMQYELKI